MSRKALTLLLGFIAVSSKAATITIPSAVIVSPYTLASGDTLLINGDLAATALTLSPGTTFTIADGGTLTNTIATAITTTGAGGNLTTINVQPHSSLDAGVGNNAVAILNNDVVNIDVQGQIIGNLTFTTPGNNTTSIYNGGRINPEVTKLLTSINARHDDPLNDIAALLNASNLYQDARITGNITGFSGVLNLDGIQPVIGTVTGTTVNATLNLGFIAPIVFAVDASANYATITSVPNIYLKNGALIISQNISSITTFENYEHGVVQLAATLTGTGKIKNYGNFSIGSTGSITAITEFTNFPNATLIIDSNAAAAPLNIASIHNHGTMVVNKALTPTLFYQDSLAPAPSNASAFNIAKLYLNAPLTVTSNLINNNKSSIIIADTITLTVTAADLKNATDATIEILNTAAIVANNVVNEGNLTLHVSQTEGFKTLLAITGDADLSPGTLHIVSNIPLPATGATALADAITATSINLPKEIVVSGTIFGEYAASLNDDHSTLSLSLTRKSFEAVTSIDKNDNEGLAKTLDFMAATATPTISEAAIVNLVQQSTDLTGYSSNLKKLTPMVMTKSIRELHRSGLKPVLIRVAQLSEANRAYAAGDNLAIENNLWLRPFFSHVKQTQNLANGLLAYRNNIYGISLGVDTRTMITKHLVGLALTISHSHIVDENLSNAKTMNHQCMVYGKYNAGGAFIDWLGSIGVSESKQNRVALDGLLAKSTYNWAQYGLRASLGYQMFADYLFSIEPDVSLQYSFLNNSKYTEAGASVGNLGVIPENNHYLVAGMGVRTYLNLAKFNYNFSNSIFARADYTLIGRNVKATANFVNSSGPSFLTKSTPSRITYSVGGSACYKFSNVKIEFVFNYDFAKNFRDQQYYLNLAYRF
jgi:hypothetical protein